MCVLLWRFPKELVPFAVLINQSIVIVVEKALSGSLGRKGSDELILPVDL